MRSFSVVVEYDGTDFFGFQVQPDRRTVQAELEKSIARVCGGPVEIVGSGRTDAGVHATGQVVSFSADCTVPVANMCDAINSVAPRDIVAVKASETHSGFHARFDAKNRTYKYYILSRNVRSAIAGRYAWQVCRPMDIGLMRDGARHFLGTHDFSAFANADDVEKSTIREVLSVDITTCKIDSLPFVCCKTDNTDCECLIVIEITASAFLRSMVRIMVGTLVEVATGKRRPMEIAEILETGDRTCAGKTAPPNGLFLTEVTY